MQSCADIYTSIIICYMRNITNYTRNKHDICEKLDNCHCEQHHKIQIEQWQTCLNRHVEDLIELNCCLEQLVSPYLLTVLAQLKEILNNSTGALFGISITIIVFNPR